jgi:hypothetical protein
MSLNVYLISTDIKMLSRAMNYLKRKRSDKGVTTTGEPSQAIVPYVPQNEVGNN